MINLGFDPMQKTTNENEWNLLHMCALGDSYECAYYLITKWSANPMVQGKDGISPLSLAQQNNHKKVADLIVQASMSPPTPNIPIITEITETTCHVTWVKVIDDEKNIVPPTIEYELSWRVKPIGRWITEVSKECEIYAKDLVPDTKYKMRLRARNRNKWSDYCSQIEFQTTPAVNSNVSDRMSGFSFTKLLDSRSASVTEGLKRTISSMSDSRKISESKSEYISSEVRKESNTSLVTSTPQEEQQNEDKQTIEKMFSAVDKNDIDTIQSLINENTNFNIIVKDGNSLLHYSSLKGNLKFVQFIIEHGGNTDILNDYKQTPFQLAIWKGYINVAKYLLEKGTSLLAIDNQGRTSLHYAAMGKDFSILCWLVDDLKQDIHSMDFQGRTCMHYIAMSGTIEMMEFLLSKGLSINDKDNNCIF